MVPNITSGSSFYGVIAYNKIKVDDGTAKVDSFFCSCIMAYHANTRQ